MDTQTQIDIITRRLDSLSNSNSIPREVEMAFRQRLSIVSGYTGTITTAKLTTLGSNGSMTFSNGILISQTQAS